MNQCTLLARDGRFNSPDATFGVMYLAEAREGAFAETFLREPGRTYVPFPFELQGLRPIPVDPLGDPYPVQRSRPG